MKRWTVATVIAMLGLAGCGGPSHNTQVRAWLSQHDIAGRSYDVSCDKNPTVGSNATPCSWYNGDEQGWLCVTFNGKSVARVERSYWDGVCG